SEGLRYSEIDRMYPDRLAPGDSGLAVRLLQHYLDLLAFFDTELQNVKVSGVFDEATAEALRYFEEIMGLPVDGVVDIPDWAALTAAYRLALSSLPAEYQEYAAKIYPGYFLNPGREGEAVTALQQAINRIAAFNADIYGVAESGVYDEDTQEAVRTLQMQAGLPATGSVGPLTWAEIIGLSYNM
ncbi:MAG: peptidoglycan-binding protein, partial [Firmicutes bacterium]|nr:peptidoglycan-binding protein [Bacillota bacterium]